MNPFSLSRAAASARRSAPIGRNAAFRVVDELRKGKADTLCLSLLVMGDEEGPGTR